MQRKRAKPNGKPHPAKRTKAGGLARVREAGVLTKKYPKMAVKQAYVEGTLTAQGRVFPTLREVASHFQIPPKTVMDWCSEENWVDQQLRFRVELEEARKRGAIEAMEEESREALKNAIRLVGGLQAQISHHLQQYRKEYDAWEANPKKHKRPDVDMLEVKHAAQALKDIVESVNRAAGPKVVPGGGVDFIEMVRYVRQKKEERERLGQANL